jgi:hypothetical protein
VECDWTGSAQGIYDTSHVNTLPNSTVLTAFLDPSNAMTTVTHATAPSSVTGGNSLSSPVASPAVAPDVSMSDVWQASTLFATAPALTEVVSNGVAVQGFVVCASKGGTSAQFPTAINYTGITLTVTAGSNVIPASYASQVLVGYTVASTPVISGQPNIPPFAVVTGNPNTGTAPGTFTISVPVAGTGTGSVTTAISYNGWSNVTAEQMAALYTNQNGALPLSQFTGFPGDSAGAVLAIGRSPDSGTRVEFTEEIGVHNETSGSQIYQLGMYDSSNNLITNSTTQIAHIQPFPAQTFDGVALSAGDYGYTSGGNVAAVLQNPTMYNVLHNWFMVSPLGISDANTAVKGGATALTFNGASYNQITLEQGTYPLWSYEHMYYLPSHTSGQVLTSANGIASQMLSADGLINGDLIGNLAVHRSPITTDGAPIFNNTTVNDLF